MKTSLFSIGFTLAIGCNATLENQQEYPAYQASAVDFQSPTKGDSERYYNAVKNYFEASLVNNSRFNGGVLVAKGNSILYEEYNGFKDFRTKEGLDAESPMHIASISKTFTATAILKLVQEEKLGLDDLLTKFFPGFPYDAVTVKMLLNHRSGIPNYVNYLEGTGWNKKVYANNQDVFNSLYSLNPKATFRAGTRFNYSNTNYLLLAMIIEKVTGLTYQDYLQESFFEPLQLKNTYVFTLADTATAIASYQANSRLWDWDFLDNTYGDKNIYTTPRDLLKWALAISNSEVIRPTLLDSAFTPYSNERKSTHNYGLGFRLLILDNGKKVIYHNGRWHGSNAAFAILPDEDVTVIVIGNKYNSNIYNVARKAYDIFGDYKQGGPLVDEDGDITFRKVYTKSRKKSVARKTKHKKYSSSGKSVSSRK